jgi:hypothetical protein
MPKQSLNEGLIDRALTAIFTSIAKKKGAILQKKFENDPKVQFHLKQLETSRDFLEDYLKGRRNDPKWAAVEKEFDQLAK